MGRVQNPQRSESVTAVQELNSTLWKPVPGATATFAEFVEARERFLALHKEEMWNPWTREENDAEHKRVDAVMAQWTRAEPGFRPMTDKEVDAYLKRVDRESEEKYEDEQRQRAARIPTFDERRHQARLELLEVQSRLQHETEKRDGLVARTSYPAMDDDRRTAAIADAGKSIAGLAERVARLEVEVGDPNTVIDQYGYLPADRQDLSLSEFRWWRERQIRELQEQIETLRASIAATTDRKERAGLRDELHQATRRHNSLLSVPPLDPQDMCSECTKPLRWHGWSSGGGRPIEAGPCPAWPAWAARLRKVRHMLEQASAERERQESTPKPPKPEPLGVIPSGLPIAEVIARLGELQTKYPTAVVRRGNRNRWELWPASSDRPAGR